MDLFRVGMAQLYCPLMTGQRTAGHKSMFSKHQTVIFILHLHCQPYNSWKHVTILWQLESSDLPALLRALPVDGEICRRRGSMKGVKEEEDLCFGTVGVCEKSMSRE